MNGHNEDGNVSIDYSMANSDIQLRNKQDGSWLHQEKVSEVKRFEDFRTIDWVEDEMDEHRRRLLKLKNVNSVSTSLRERVVSSCLNWVMLTLMGVFIGLIAASLNIITAWLASLRMGHCSGHFYLNKSFCCWGEDEQSCSNWVPWSNHFPLSYLAYVLISLLFSFTASILVKYFAPSAAGSGISEIKSIVSGFAMDGFLGWWTLFIKSTCLPLAIASGLSVGKEGPSVHYAVCVGNSVAKLVSRYRRSAARAREFLTATSAAGVAVAFGSPMGGVLFSIEEISSVFQLSTIWKSYFCSLVAVATLAAINPFHTGQLVLFEVSYDTDWHYFEIPFYIILGVFGGIYGIIVSKLNIRVVSFRKKYLGNYAVREVFILALLTACFSYFNEFLRLDMTESMEILFHECDSKFDHRLCDIDSNKIPLITSLLFATIARMGLTIITYGCKVPAGIFVPSMAAGATFGRALGLIVDHFYQSHKDSSLFMTCTEGSKCIIPGTYAFLGAAAGLCGITDLTVTVVIIMFELTGALRYIVPTMIVVAITKSISDKWGKGGIADQMITFNGLPLIDSKEEFSFGTNVEAAMCSATVCFPADPDSAITLKQLRTTLRASDYKGFPIIESPPSPKIVGFVSRSDIEYILEKFGNTSESTDEYVCLFSNDRGAIPEEAIDFSSILNKSPLTVNITTSLEYIVEVFLKLGPRYILVENDGCLAGIITRKDMMRYEHTIHTLHSTDTSRIKEEEFNDKVWKVMNDVTNDLKRNIGRLLHNDENRYL
ncbi:voltage-gated chloride channel [Scheffersomyces amazonensis]|uniref:voltage-gated chloride channel n=1 Tax=Scheffersomyces amazonensis TaxID=1078765 RepID=UPI00315C5FC9